MNNKDSQADRLDRICHGVNRAAETRSEGETRTTRRVTGIFVLMAGLATFSARTAQAQGFAPTEAARRMSVADGLEVRLVAAEPLIRQPVAIEFDDRGRLWVIQYMQYPNPAELKRVAVDRYSRTVYDRIPDPPPRGPKGADRITILEDTDGDGRADRSRDFVTGLNLASGLAFGYGGVFVIQVPYLLFYPDRDHDDRPDGDPEVLLSGFGMEDAHSVANSLTWGPDGWLYGLQGSTVTAKSPGRRVSAGRVALSPDAASGSSSSARAGATCGASTSTATASSSPAPTWAGSSCSTAFREAITGSRSASTGRSIILTRSVTSTTFVTPA